MSLAFSIQGFGVRCTGFRVQHSCFGGILLISPQTSSSFLLKYFLSSATFNNKEEVLSCAALHNHDNSDHHTIKRKASPGVRGASTRFRVWTIVWFGASGTVQGLGVTVVWCRNLGHCANQRQCFIGVHVALLWVGSLHAAFRRNPRRDPLQIKRPERRFGRGWGETVSP